MVPRGAILVHAPDAERLPGDETEMDELYPGARRKGSVDAERPARFLPSGSWEGTDSFMWRLLQT